ncbi:MAG: hypothetical protein JEZ08_13625 [Clostridiales bacterium]|nr:hypothetical protein [Clostridiales bacterium]
MSDYIEDNEVKTGGSDDLLDEFQKLILDVSQEIIDTSLMTDLKALRQDLNNEMGNFSEQATKIGTITTNIDSLLSQTTVNMSAAVKKTTSDMEEFLSGTKEMLDQKFADILSSLDSILEGTSSMLESKFGTITSNLDKVLEDTSTMLDSKFETISSNLDQILDNHSATFDRKFEGITSDIGTVLSETSETLVQTVEQTKQELNALLSDSSLNMSTITGNVEQVVKSLSTDLEQVLTQHNKNLDFLLNDAISKVDLLVNSTTESFGEEIKMIQDYLINSDKLIRNNQRTIADIQRSIEEKLNDTLVQVLEQSQKSKDNLAIVVEKIEDLVTNMSKEVYALRELNNTINIKVDHGISKLKGSIESSDKRFKFLLLMNSGTLLVVIISLITMLLRG